MKTTAYLCLLVVILVQSVDGLSVSCIGGNCEPVETRSAITTARETDGTPTAITTATATLRDKTTISIEWPDRRVICPPFDPYQYETLLEVFRRLSVETYTNVPTSAKPTKPIYYPEFFKRLLKSPKSHKVKDPTDTPTQDVKQTEFLPTTRRQTPINVSPTQSYVAKKQSSTTEIPHIFAWRLK